MLTMKKEKAIIKKGHAFVFLSFVLLFLCASNSVVWADGEKTQIAGKSYELERDNDYSISEAGDPLETNNDNSYGVFCIDGNIVSNSEKSGVPIYEVEDKSINFYYNYDNALLTANEDSWHLVEDKGKKINGIAIDKKINKGTIVIQTSKDRVNWINALELPNAFEEFPIRIDPIYSATDVQLINGCYYRVMIAYELGIRIKADNILFVNTDKYDYRKHLEVYEFYLYSKDKENTNQDKTYSLGTKAKAKTFDGYADTDENAITKDDIHYGWDIGNFYVSGYTEEVAASDGTPVFLKNVGDKVTLWFNLKQNIDAINGEKNLSITSDEEGSDQGFQTKRMDFGRGTLIIQETDRNNNKKEPQIYSNYLEANTKYDADTKVLLCEEGDYEVALDYEVTSDRLIDKIGHYRIYFKFSVRNGNCMVYPFDSVTGAELSNSSMTENGFTLDLANSKYLKINLKREVLKDGAAGLTEDIRFNGPAKENAIYDEEGIYTITVSNDYTNQFTVKKIYVGTNKVLKAYMKTGLSISEIYNLLSQGADISKDGEITLPPPTEADIERETSINDISTETISDDTDDTKTENSLFNMSGRWPVVLRIVIVVLASIALVFLSKKKRKGNKTKIQNGEGGEEQ